MKKYCLLFVLAMSLFSCQKEELSVNTKSDVTNAIEIVKLNKNQKSANDLLGVDNEYVMKFKDQLAYSNFILELTQKTEEERLKKVNAFNSFTSLASIYDKAMSEAAEIDFTEAQYNSFKTKYKDYLYFPEYKDDYAAYIPLSDPLMANIVNSNGLYMIGNQILAAEKVLSYSDLQKTGQAYYDLNSKDSGNLPDLSGLIGKFEEAEDAMRKMEDLLKQINSNSKKDIYAHLLAVGPWWFDKQKIGGEEYEFVKDWTEVGNGKKIRITFGRIYTTSGGNYPKVRWHSEVSFRKKGFLGRWYNYKSETSFKAKIQYNDARQQSFYYAHDGASSHDGYLDVLYSQITPLDNYIVYNIATGTTPSLGKYPLKLYIFKGYSVSMEITYRGMSNTMYLSDKKDDVYGYTISENGL